MGSLQPGPLGEMVNRPDPQGYFDRHIYIPADRDTSVQFLDRLKPVPEQVCFIFKSKGIIERDK